MSKPDVFATIRRARSLRERHPDAPHSVVHVALELATYADGRTGTNIRPSYERMAEETGLSIRHIRRLVRWLETHGELRRDKEGHRGSAACFTFLGVSAEKTVTGDPLCDGKAVIDDPKGGHRWPPTNPTRQEPSGPNGPPGAVSGAASQDGEPEGEPRPGCFKCGSPTEPYHDWCHACIAEEREVGAQSSARLLKRGRDDNELRRARGPA